MRSSLSIWKSSPLFDIALRIRQFSSDAPSCPKAEKLVEKLRQSIADDNALLLAGAAKQPSISLEQQKLNSNVLKKKNLIGLSQDDLRSEFTALGLEKFRGKQVFNWIYAKGATSFNQMTNLKKDVRELLDSTFEIRYGEPVMDTISEDGTRKWLVNFSDSQQCESVFIPEVSRGTLCISSQIGCSLSCKFCHTGTQKLMRNLHASELLGQVMMAKKTLGDYPRGSLSMQETNNQTLNNGPPLLSNVVLMGQGEPLYNFRQVSQAIRIALDQDGLALSKRRVTLSTSGVVPLIPKVATEIGCSLAISLHATTNDIRSEIMPINKTYPLADLMDACRQYNPLSKSTSRITFEYVMLKGVNDSIHDARRLVKLLDGIESLVNLIPFNPWPGSPFECSDEDTIIAFSNAIYEKGIPAPVRWPRGRDILAACGQLKTHHDQTKATAIAYANAVAAAQPPEEDTIRQ